jgi:hypothetical protein
VRVPHLLSIERIIKMASVDLSTSKFDFEFTHMELVTTRNPKEPLVSYFGDFRGRKLFHIRKLWNKGTEENPLWAPGKGLSVGAEDADSICKAIGSLAMQKVNGS